MGDYSFTTVHPQVGVVEYSDYMQISIADLPGLLTDISRGFGTRYLMHLEKCSILVFVVDASSAVAESVATPLEQYTNVRKIIVDYNQDFFLSKKKIILANKIESENDDDDDKGDDHDESLSRRLDELKAGLVNLGDADVPVVPVSAKKRINLAKFLRLLRHVFISQSSSSSSSLLK